MRTRMHRHMHTQIQDFCGLVTLFQYIELLLRVSVWYLSRMLRAYDFVQRVQTLMYLEKRCVPPAIDVWMTSSWLVKVCICRTLQLERKFGLGTLWLTVKDIKLESFGWFCRAAFGILIDGVQPDFVLIMCLCVYDASFLWRILCVYDCFCQGLDIQRFQGWPTGVSRSRRGLPGGAAYPGALFKLLEPWTKISERWYCYKTQVRLSKTQ